MRFIALNALALALLAGSPCSAWAIYYGPQTRPGTFGTRTLGQPLAPRQSQFGGGLQRNANGQFLGVGRPDARMFNSPWQRSAPAFVPALVVPPQLDLPLPPAPQWAPPTVLPMPFEIAPPAPPTVLPMPIESAPPAPPPVPTSEAPPE